MVDQFEIAHNFDNMTEQERLDLLEFCMNQYGHDIKRLIFSYVKNHSDTDDITQEVFIKVYNKSHQFKGDAALKTWVYRIAINLCKDYLRSIKTKQRFIKEKLIQIWDERENPTPEEQSIEQESANQLFSYVEELPIKYREVIILYYFENLSLQEISHALNLNINTTKARLRRSRDRLKSKLSEYGGDLIG